MEVQDRTGELVLAPAGFRPPPEPGVADGGDHIGVDFALALQARIRPQRANYRLVNEIFRVRVISGKEEREPPPIREPITPRVA